MGGEPWFYIVPYQPDIGKALGDLKQREFEAGRYNPVQPFQSYSRNPATPSPGAGHSTIAEAIEAAGASGTRSILDMERVASDPDDIDYGVVTPLTEDYILEQFGTSQVTRKMMEDDPILAEDIDRGQGVYMILFESGKPSEICFAGYSYD